ncbi:MAG TPA: type II secretion system F family protein [Bacillota bacterium]|nr:type II secretion system F family protein [Bacillota bacterium]
MNFQKIKWIGIGISLVIIIFSFLIFNTKYFFLVLGIGILIGAAPFVFSIIRETKIATEKEDMFLEFSRNLVESVKTGTPINKSIINVKDKPYGVLSENIKKLANQISLGIPLQQALQVFSKDVKNRTISRSLTLIGQAEKSGGEISVILESVTEAVSTVEKLKKERKSAISTLVVQGYIIFFVFIVIILVLRFQILPLLIDIAPDLGGAVGGGGIGGIGGTGMGGGGAPLTQEEISSSFLYLLLVQGFFSGLVIGKLSEGNIKAGIRHSFILMLVAFLIATGSGVLFGG